MMLVLDLCTGIGGLTLGYIAHGYQPALFCEQNQYCQQILQSRFGNIPIISDIKDVTAIALSNLGLHAIGGIVAGLPCPAFSVAGKRQASKDPRNLFPEFFRIVREVRPRWFVIENVPGLLTAENGGFFAGVLREIAALGFDAEWGIISAASVGAVHLRERIFIIAYTNCHRRHGGANNWGERRIYPDQNRNAQEAFTNGKQLFVESRKDGSVSSHSKSGTSAELLGCDRYLQARSNPALIGSGHVTHNSTQMLELAFCRGDDGLPAGVDQSLLRHEQLDEWLAAATIPRINRLSATQIAALSPTEQRAYRECWEQYQSMRRSHKEAIASLGNAVVPQVAIKVFHRLKEIL